MHLVLNCGIWQSSVANGAGGILLTGPHMQRIIYAYNFNNDTET